jgi:hypothetical protein
MRPDELERRLRQRLNALDSAPRAELLDVLTLPDFERIGAIQAPLASCYPRPSARGHLRGLK